MSASIGSRHYNPDWLDDDALVASFIARQSDFGFLRDELARVPLVGSVQHHLLVGQRGSGKTTLLKRLAVAIRREPELSDHLIALSFPEELYQVKNLADFWWAACEALGDELERLGHHEQARHLFDEIDRGEDPGPSRDAPAGLTRLLATCQGLQRRPVMLVDNLDLVITRIEQGARSKHKGPGSNVYWSLREALSTTTSPVVIGGSVSLSEPFTRHDKAFYDFFLPRRLGRLPLDEVRRVLEHLAAQQDRPEVKARLAENPARVETLYELTGGNPRAIGLIFGLLQQGPNGKAVDDFERLMDLTTPYYKARFEDLPEQAQVVMHALAVRRPGDGSGLRFGHTAADIAGHAGLATNTVSAQMDVLSREGLVEKSSGPGRTQYRIAEQLFRLWLQMRGSRRVRQNVIGLAEFLEAWFTGEELMAQLHAAPSRSGALLSFAVADTAGAGGWRHGLLAHGADLMLSHSAAHGTPLDEALPDGDLPEDLDRLKRWRLQLKHQATGGLTAEECKALLGSLTMAPEQKAASVEALCRPESAAAEAARLRPMMAAERQRLLRYGLRAEDLPLLFELRTKGQLPLPHLKPTDADAANATQPNAPIRPLVWRLLGARDWVRLESEAVADDWLRWGERHAVEASSTEWANVAGAMRRSRRFKAAEQALRCAFLRGDSARAFYERASLSCDTGGNTTDAEADYREAIELDSTDAWSWDGLGSLFQATNRTQDAEIAYSKAIELDPTFAWPWLSLGILFANKLNRPQDAEIAFRKAIEIDPDDAEPWAILGALFADKLNRPQDAEIAYRRAIEIDPTFAGPWNGLGILFADSLNRPQDAEAAYRKAIEIDPAFAGPWNGLGILFADSLNRPQDAEAAYRKAIEIDPAFAGPWNNLGNLLAGMLNRPQDAEAAYRKAIKIDPDDVIPLNNLGLLLANMNRPDEAEAAFRRALERDPQDGRAWGRLAGLLAKRGQFDEARHGFEYAAERDPELADYWQLLLQDARSGQIAQRTYRAFHSAGIEAAHLVLAEALETADSIPTLLATDTFADVLLVPLLDQPDQARAVLAMLRDLGLDRHARPLLLAFEAAIEQRPQALDDLEPEVRRAAQRIFRRLTAERPAG